MPWTVLLRDRNIILLAASYLSVGYFEFLFFYWTYYYFGTVRQMGDRASATYTTVLFLAFLVMSPIGGWATDLLASKYGTRTARRAVPIFCLTLSAACLFCGTNLKAALPTVAILSFAMGLAGASEASYWSSAIDIGRGQVGSACGILNTGGNIGGLVAPVLTPFIAARFGWDWSLYGGCAILLLGVLTWFFIEHLSGTPTDLLSSSETISA